MPVSVPVVEKTDTFEQWRLKTNEIAENIAEVESGAAGVGDVGDLLTDDKTNTVAAINETFTIATLADAKADTALEGIGTVGDLTTAATDLTAAVNEHDTEIGTIASLPTTEKSNLVGALTEVNTHVGDVTTLTTTAKESAVAAVNELDSEVGTLSSLNTTAKNTLVGAINEVFAAAGEVWEEETGTARTIGAADNRKTIFLTNSGSVTITLDDATPVGFYCKLFVEDVLDVSVEIEGTDVLNGGTDPFTVNTPYIYIEIYQRVAGSWLVY
jgi:hypothetical protein